MSQRLEVAQRHLERRASESVSLILQSTIGGIRLYLRAPRIFDKMRYESFCPAHTMAGNKMVAISKGDDDDDSSTKPPKGE